MVPDHMGLAITAPFRLETRRSITSSQIARMLQIWTERKHIIAKFGHPLAADRLPARTWRPPGSSLHRNHGDSDQRPGTLLRSQFKSISPNASLQSNLFVSLRGTLKLFVHTTSISRFPVPVSDFAIE